MKITFVTTNNVKFKIACDVLSKYGITMEQRKMELSELQTINLDDVVMDKAKQVAKTFKENFIVDDSGLYIDALADFPGALLKPTMYALGEEKFLRLMNGEKNRRARFVSELVFYNSKTNEFSLIPSTMTGTIVDTISLGTRRVGYSLERIFVPDGETKPIAELDDKEWEALYSRTKTKLHYEELGRKLSADTGQYNQNNE